MDKGMKHQAIVKQLGACTQKANSISLIFGVAISFFADSLIEALQTSAIEDVGYIGKQALELTNFINWVSGMQSVPDIALKIDRAELEGAFLATQAKHPFPFQLPRIETAQTTEIERYTGWHATALRPEEYEE